MVDHEQQPEVGDDRLLDERRSERKDMSTYMLRGSQWASQAQMNQPMATAA